MGQATGVAFKQDVINLTIDVKFPGILNHIGKQFNVPQSCFNSLPLAFTNATDFNGGPLIGGLYKMTNSGTSSGVGNKISSGKIYMVKGAINYVEK